MVKEIFHRKVQVQPDLIHSHILPVKSEQKNTTRSQIYTERHHLPERYDLYDPLVWSVAILYRLCLGLPIRDFSKCWSRLLSIMPRHHDILLFLYRHAETGIAQCDISHHATLLQDEMGQRQVLERRMMDVSIQRFIAIKLIFTFSHLLLWKNNQIFFCSYSLDIIRMSLWLSEWDMLQSVLK